MRPLSRLTGKFGICLNIDSDLLKAECKRPKILIADGKASVLSLIPPVQGDRHFKDLASRNGNCGKKL